MNTNQMMQIQIGKNYTVQIGHLDQMGKLNDVLEIGNEYRKEKGYKEIGLDEYLRRQETWEFIIEVEHKYGKTTKREIPVLEKDDKNRVLYSKFIKQFSVIKSQRGGKPENRGVWANLQIMLDLAIYLSPTLRLEMIDVFINQKILFWRDVGGDNFKEFNKLVDTLPDRADKNNTGVYVAVAKMIRAKLEILDTKGYNEKEHNSLVQINRSKWLENLSFVIENGFVNSYEELKETFQKLKVIEKE
jgi:predicted DNA-binding ArsR family transcriptional regulator